MVSGFGWSGLRRPDGSRRYRFADEEADGTPYRVEGSRWSVRHYMTLRRRIRDTGLFMFFGVVFLSAMGVFMLWTELHRDRDAKSVWLGVLSLVAGLSFVPMGVALLRMAKSLSAVSLWRFRVSVFASSAVLVVCGLVLWAVSRDVSWASLIGAYAFIPSYVSWWVRGFVVEVAPDDDGAGSDRKVH